MSGDDRDRLINVNVAIALARRHNTGERAAALADEEADLTNAWRENPEFSMALNSAVMLDDIRPLKQYLFSDKPLSGGNRRSLAGYIDLLVERIASQKRKRGRPMRSATKARPAERAERNAAWLVASAQKAWRKQHGRRRVPGDVIDAMIREACEEAARAFDVPVRTVRTANVRSALKTGRFVVP